MLGANIEDRACGRRLGLQRLEGKRLAGLIGGHGAECRGRAAADCMGNFHGWIPGSNPRILPSPGPSQDQPMISTLKPGQTIRCTIAKAPRAAAKIDTIERLMRQEPSVKS